MVPAAAVIVFAPVIVGPFLFPLDPVSLLVAAAFLVRSPLLDLLPLVIDRLLLFLVLHRLLAGVLCLRAFPGGRVFQCLASEADSLVGVLKKFIHRLPIGQSRHVEFARSVEDFPGDVLQLGPFLRGNRLDGHHGGSHGGGDGLLARPLFPENLEELLLALHLGLGDRVELGLGHKLARLLPSLGVVAFK